MEFPLVMRLLAALWISKRHIKSLDVLRRRVRHPSKLAHEWDIPLKGSLRSVLSLSRSSITRIFHLCSNVEAAACRLQRHPQLHYILNLHRPKFLAGLLGCSCDCTG